MILKNSLRKAHFGVLIKSYTKGSNFPPMSNLTISKQLDIIAHKHPERLAIISHHQQTSITYQFLYEKAILVAANFIDMGIQRGTRIAVFMPMCYQFSIIQMACSMTDSILISISCDFSAKDLNERLNIVHTDYLITSDFDDKLNILQTVQELPQLIKALSPAEASKSSSSSIRKIFVLNFQPNSQIDSKFESFEKNLLEKEPSLKGVNTVKSIIHFQNPGSSTLICFTSGTTGKPKAVTLNHNSLMNNGANFAIEMGFCHNDKILLPLSLSQTFGVCMGNLSALSVGAAVIYPQYKLNPAQIVQAINKHQPTSILGSANIYLGMIKHLDGKKLEHNIQKGILGGSICTETLINEITQKLSIKSLTVCYGMTETSSVCFMTKSGDNKEKKIHTVGTVMKHLEAKLVDQNGFIVNTGLVGELMIKGYSVFTGYYNNKETTRDSLIEGWVRSGDLGILDSDGYLCITGHKKNLILRSGRNVSPEDVEKVLLEIAEIKEVKVVGVPDELNGEEVCAFVIKKEGCENFDLSSQAEFIKSKLKSWQRPKYVMYVESFPTTVTGKIQKFKLRDVWINISQNEEERKKAEIE